MTRGGRHRDTHGPPIEAARPARHRTGLTDYHVQRLPPQRTVVLDLLAYARRIPAVHGLLEVDVTEARRRLRDQARVSFTAFILATVAAAVRAHPEVNVRRAGARLVRFDHIDIVVTVEQQKGGATVPLPHVFRATETREFSDLAAELAEVRDRRDRGERPTPTMLERMPSTVRRLGVRIVARFPAGAARLGPAIGISSLGMFGSGIAWAVPLSPVTLMVTVGGIGTLPDTSGAQRDILALTLSFDHSVVDGAPAARFATTLRELLENAEVLGTNDAVDMD